MSVQEYNVVTSFSFKYTLFNENKKIIRNYFVKLLNSIAIYNII